MKNMKLTRLSIRLLLVLWGLTLIAGVVSAQLSAEELAEKDTMPNWPQVSRLRVAA